ncbi:conserved membrane protein of unknown function [Rhodovastum atsumiense]|uniref:DUF2975 domain-containing protein n=1 Tax=Rhodovastum atsumiense TaxID=504468 RepID=A0A5M6IPW3_9PROT|nr:DUF2975 domain-containing protein [Rhodovastum atsumiense]KAA5610286.1 DUF2975 domain-containing protein [Rhodovastum atsumiense]CAH2602227.1 conserved membrane protein of unknown function [Rhodovastum atsumiense]
MHTAQPELPTTPSRHVRRLSLLLSLACLVAILALPVLVIGKWATAEPTELYRMVVAANGSAPVANLPDRLDAWQRVLGVMLAMVPCAFTMLALGHARRCFGLFARGVCFDHRIVSALRGFAGGITLSVGLEFLMQAPLSALLSWHNPVGHRFITFGIGTEPVQSLLFAGAVWIIAAVMASAEALAQENAAFV